MYDSQLAGSSDRRYPHSVLSHPASTQFFPVYLCTLRAADWKIAVSAMKENTGGSQIIKKGIRALRID